MTWNGSVWAAQELAPPEDVVMGELNAVKCVSASACTAVGSSVDDENVKVALALRWDGTDWESQSVPSPEGALSAKLADVSCISSSACVAVGNYVDQNEVKKSLAVKWDGSSWSLKSVPIPSGAGLSELTSVSCTSISDCVAVGSFINSSEVTKTLAAVWNGTGWSIIATPEPAGAELSQLQDISCRVSEACTAVGQYFNSTGDQKTLALRRNTSGEWSIQTTPNQAGALARSLTAVSCPSSSACTAVGVVEQGRKEIPIVLAWNGTSWSEQPIDSEALGAAAVNLTGVHCLSTTDCNATGSVSYGRSSARRNLAFHFNGTTWLVSEEGGYEREWTALDVSGATSGLSDVSCPTSQKCVSVGRLTDDYGSDKAQVATWSGGSWKAQATPSSSDAVSSELSGVSCTSFNSCWAVGSVVKGDEEPFSEETEETEESFSEGTTEPLAMNWNGSTWSIHSTPLPSGGFGGQFSAIDCVSPSACTAVGSYIDEEGTQLPLIITFNGSFWSLASVDPPNEVPYNWLSSVSCASIGSCVAAGGQADPFGHEQSLAVRWNGSSWSSLETPLLDGNAPNQFQGVSCPMASQCMLVGDYEDQDGKDQSLAMGWDGSEWEALEVPDREETISGLTAVSCPSTDRCMMVGDRPGVSSEPPLLLSWSEGAWSQEAAADFAGGAVGVELMGVSCVSVEECHASGSASYDGSNAKNLTLTYDQGGWFVSDSVSSGGGLRGVACLSAGECLAVGDSTVPAGNPAMGWRLSEDGWEASETVVPGAYLSDVTCIAEEDCIVIGRSGSWPFEPVAQRWDGEDWSTQSIQIPADRSSNLESISCPSTTYCLAAGFSWPEVGAGPTKPLVERWLGSGWTTSVVPLPGSAVSAFLHDISCASSAACVAVGAYTDSAGTYHGLVERWDGSSWTQSSISPPGGQSYRLLGVDCTSSTACTAVGRAISHSSGARSPLAARWNGTSWNTQTVTLPSGSSAGTLVDVDCYSSTRCLAVGSATDASSQNPFIATWANSTWGVEPAPLTEASYSGLDSLSCPTAGDCVAVGSAQSPGALREPVAIQTKGESESEDPPPVSNTDPAPRLTEEQEEEAVELLTEDPGFQAVVGASEYVIGAIGPWTETEGETGEQTTVGVYIAVSLVEPDSWEERTWPTAAYPVEVNGYSGGTYAQTDFEASAKDILAIQAHLDTEIDSEGHIVDGEAVQISPMPFDPLAPKLDDGHVEVNPESVELNLAAGGY